MEKFGRTLIFVFALLIVIQGIRMAAVIVRPQVEALSPGAAQILDYIKM